MARGRALARTIRGLSTATTQKIAGFDGIRALAALTVVGIHSAWFSDLGYRTALLVQPVTIFFVLSGFLISRNLLLERDTREGGVDLGRFWVRRSRRILPCYVGFLVVVLLVRHTGLLVSITDRHLMLSAVYLANFVDRAHYSGPLGSLWSLAVEEHFYLLWPLAVALLPRRALAGVATGVIAACAGVRVWILAHPTVLETYFWGRFTVPAMDALLIGCLLAIATKRYGTLAPRISSPGWPLVGVVAVVLYASPLWIPSSSPSRIEFFSYYLQVVGMAIGLWWVLSNQGSIVTRMLELPPLRGLGRISYGIYVWQGFWLSTGPGDQIHAVQRPPLAIPIILATALASWFLVERPFLVGPQRAFAVSDGARRADPRQWSSRLGRRRQ